MMNPRLQALLHIYLLGRLTEDQRRELAGLLENDTAAEQLAALVQEQLSKGEYSIEGELPGTEDRIVEGVLRRLQAAPVRRVSFIRRWGWAAAVILLLGVGGYVRMNGKHERLAAGGQDIVPGGNKAILVLSDGTTITLDSAVGGVIARQGGSSIVKTAGGRIVYRSSDATRDRAPESAGAGETMMNTMRTPRGGNYRLTLPDGTQVWLNAASSITYPAAFTGKQRNVRISGEVYFEVVKNKELPFMVSVDGGADVEVLGTGFDVNAYTDEGSVKTTLLEGSVRVGKVVLKPGQQAQVSQQKVSVVNNVDIDKVMAWKNGLFNFQDVSLREVMRQLERWYDIEVVYRKNVPDIRFEGEISRNINLSDLLKVLARADVKFSIEGGRRLVVLP